MSEDKNEKYLNTERKDGFWFHASGGSQYAAGPAFGFKKLLRKDGSEVTDIKEADGIFKLITRSLEGEFKFE